MKNGCGAEWLVFEQSVFEFLKNRYFEKSLVRMGGNAGIMANALSQLGASRVIPNVAVPSKTQLSLFSEKAIYFPDAPMQITENSGAEPEKNMGTVSGSQEPIHFVFDFSEGDTFSLYGTEIRVPRENRFIATCDHLNLRLFVNPAFEKYALQHACEIDGVLISGFHLLLESYPDGSSYKTILENSLSQLRRWKAANDKLQDSPGIRALCKQRDCKFGLPGVCSYFRQHWNERRRTCNASSFTRNSCRRTSAHGSGSRRKCGMQAGFAVRA